MKLNNVDEATRIAQQILNMQVQKVISRKQALAAIKKLEFYKELLVP